MQPKGENQKALNGNNQITFQAQVIILKRPSKGLWGCWEITTSNKMSQNY